MVIFVKAAEGAAWLPGNGQANNVWMSREMVAAGCELPDLLLKKGT